eukprot:6211996-Pleurochrysis_carterae.AAC.2
MSARTLPEHSTGSAQTSLSPGQAFEIRVRGLGGEACIQAAHLGVGAPTSTSTRPRSGRRAARRPPIAAGSRRCTLKKYEACYKPY